MVEPRRSSPIERNTEALLSLLAQGQEVYAAEIGKAAAGRVREGLEILMDVLAGHGYYVADFQSKPINLSAKTNFN